MFFYFAPELVVVEIVGGGGGQRGGGGGGEGNIFVGAVAGDDEERGDKGFLEVGEAEVLCDTCDGGTEFLGEFDPGFALELLAPVIAVHGAFLLARHGE